MVSPPAPGIVGSLLIAALAACSAEETTGNPGSGGGTGGAGHGGSPSGGAGGGGAGGCTPGARSDCYSGPPATRDVGVCRAGVATCEADGSGFGSCMGEVLPGVEDCTAADDEDCNGTSEACASGTLEWLRSYGAEGSLTVGSVVAIAAGGDIVLGAGVHQGTVDFGGGPLPGNGFFDIVIAKIDAQGNHVWSQRFGSDEGDGVAAVALAGNDDVVFGGSIGGPVDFGGGLLQPAGTSDGYVARFDARGAHLWSKKFGLGGGGTYPGGLAVDGTGAILVGGTFNGSVDFGGGPLTSVGFADIFVAKLDAQGEHLWSVRLGGGTTHTFEGMAVDASGATIVTGYYDGSPNFGGGPLPSAETGAYVVKLHPDGSHAWSRGFGGEPNLFGVEDVASDASGNIVLSGNVSGAVDLGGAVATGAPWFDSFLVQLTPAGQYATHLVFSGTAFQRPRSVAVDPAGDILTCGTFEGNVDFGGPTVGSAGGTDGFIAKHSNTGTHIFSRSLGATGTDFCGAIRSTAAGSIVATGFFENSIDFGGGPVRSQGTSDAFLVKLEP